MSSTRLDPKVDDYLRKAKRWQEEMTLLREIVNSCGLTEELKWYQPCYTVEGKNVAIISSFKDHCIIGLFKGALLKDPEKILVKPGQNTQSGRQIRFTSLQEIKDKRSVLKKYLKDAIQLEKTGAKVDYKKTEAYQVPAELLQAFQKSKAFKSAFEALTPGRQRGYLLYFSSAKQSATRSSRIEKSKPDIFSGKGLHD
jgi:uncharacterized protein YdeI (YjbR/CyaY-like superfamily)